MPTKASSSSRQTYELNAETVAALRAAVAADPAKLQRLEERLVRSGEQAARRTALERKVALLRSRNALLRAAAQPPAGSTGGINESATASVTSSTSHGNTVSAFDSTLTRGLSPPSPATASAVVAHSVNADEFDESSINRAAPPVPDTWGSQRSVFRYTGPSVKGMVSAVMQDGMLYRVITDKGEWAFYNDTRYYVVQVRYRLLGGSAVTPGPSVTVAAAGVDEELSMELGPEETKVLLKGKVVDFENLSTAALLPKRAATAEEEHLLCQEPRNAWKAIAAAYPPAAAASGGDASGSSDRSTINVEELLAYCIEHHLRFVDPTFFACHASLYRHNIDEFFIVPLHWRSPSAYLPDDDKVRREVRLFRGPDFNVDGLNAGHFFPDGEFLSCVSGLACRCPEQLRKLFLHPSSAEEGRRERAVGAFRVSLCRSGWWESVVVDSFLPASSTCPEFSHCADDLRLLWLPLLQKACAKLCRSYAASLNVPMEGLVGRLTGDPCCTLRELWPSRDDLRSNTTKAVRFFSTLKKLLRGPSPSPSTSLAGLAYLCWLRPYSLTTARSRDTRDKLEKLYRDVGLRPGTAAVVLGLETLEDGQCMVRLRQTAAEKKPVEAWLVVWRSAKKPWVDSVSDFVFALGDAEGTVWMALEDIPQYFQSGYLTPLTSDWAAVKARGCFANERPSLALQVTAAVPTRVLVTVTQAETEASRRTKGSITSATFSSSSNYGEKSEMVKTASVLAGLSCLAFSKGTADALRFVGLNSDTADVFELSTAAPRFAYERDVSVGLLLDPHRGPYYFIPCLHANAADVPYTVTVQAQVEFLARKGGAAQEAKLSVGFVKVNPDAALFQNAAKPTLRQSSITPWTSPLTHQVRPPHNGRITIGEGTSVNLSV
ncbi:putative calpain-like cysteine peptidase putativecysteine peptidase Clan CA family C2 [Leptomonas pyrrhocoris]|uniref:Putative calpain-like cysteine peptidase putativecysteine peptidase Clan CA family C2 n=1 Tax=Leptomonas pyrrhocoris TaxID=157538 RepID=A0A0M9FQR8_LEPPY|nr:putative calpain-like cysteine peptidase putativecysteine peptidase Clan CA family C2 [Leptomonas pyrrhocoris]KPA73946.1 putative calpain-like cysteine peptidase putativecysteine peptidase Clan CA family C2 [Leptomonas pyrrhocoris]|eukprot:XP_015652385.1 putative calpain-like cysteine peptidase putativecysteine peptidase Clan CA family C2 [Leptomonas pyrrhocoris]